MPPTNAQGGIDYLKAIQQARRAVAGLSPQEANQRMIVAGLDEGTRNAVMASTSELAKWTDANKKSAAQVGANTEAAQNLERSWLQLKNDAVGLSAVVLGQTTPALEAMFAAIDKWTAEESFLNTLNQIGAALKAIAGFAKDIQDGNWGTALGNAAGGLWDWVKGGFHAGNDDGITSIARMRHASLFAGLEKQYGLPKGLLDRVATAESHYDSNAVSKAGAVGTFQLMPKYFPGAGQNDANDANMAAAYLAKLHQSFGGDKGDPDWSKAVAAYNAGQTRVKNVLAGKATLPGETSNYVNKVLGAGASHPTGSTRGPGSLSIGNISITLPNAKNASDVANGLGDAIQRRFNVFQTDAGLV
jgi:soluble lytic murein transglycosylase-like protein